MKKLIAILLTLCIFLSLLAGCELSFGPETTEPTETERPSETEKPTETEQPTEPVTEPPVDYMADIQRMLQDTYTLCAVGYLGICDGDFSAVQSYLRESGIMESLPILESVTADSFIEAEGQELYLVIPREDVGITVFEQTMDEDTYETVWSRSLYVGFETEPLLLRGNVSEIFPNLGLFIEGQGGETVEYSPCLSLEDGSLTSHRLICDITPTHLLPGGYDGPQVGGEDVRMGSWYGNVLNTAGETMMMELTLNYDGFASYGYGPPEQSFYEYFQGDWHDEDGKLVLELFGGVTDYEEEDSHYSIRCVFEWEYRGGYLFLVHVDGTSLIYGLEGGTFEFLSYTTTSLAGLWVAYEYDYETDGYIYYDLELYSDGNCNYLVHNGEGNTFAAYEGQWSMEGINLSLSLTMFSGRDYKEGSEQTLRTVCQALFDDLGSLVLIPIDGDAITNFMAEMGEDYFEPGESFG